MIIPVRSTNSTLRNWRVELILRNTLASGSSQVRSVVLIRIVNERPATDVEELNSSMSDFQTVAKVGEIPDGEGRAYRVNDRMVAVFLIAGRYTAIDDICPHMGASLAAGFVENGAVNCPWHDWSFNVCNGTWMNNPKGKICQEVFEVRIAGDEIQVRAPA